MYLSVISSKVEEAPYSGEVLRYINADIQITIVLFKLLYKAFFFFFLYWQQNLIVLS